MMMRAARWAVIAVLASAGAAAVAGCGGGRLETGYRYRPLGASDAERRGYYAADFTPEAAAAEERRRGPDAPRPPY